MRDSSSSLQLNGKANVINDCQFSFRLPIAAHAAKLKVRGRPTGFRKPKASDLDSAQSKIYMCHLHEVWEGCMARRNRLTMRGEKSRTITP